MRCTKPEKPTTRWQLLTSDAERSWYNMIRVGSTISLEAWDDKYKPNQDWNHAWGAAPANIVPRRLMGVVPTEPGFSRIEIRPQPAGLEKASLRMPTIRGRCGNGVRKHARPFHADNRRTGQRESRRLPALPPEPKLRSDRQRAACRDRPSAKEIL